MKRCCFPVAITGIIVFAVSLWATDPTRSEQTVAKAQNGPVKVLSVSGIVNSLSWSPDGVVLAVLTGPIPGRKDPTDALRLYDVKTGRPLRTLSEHHHSTLGTTVAILDATFSPDGKTVAGVFWKRLQRKDQEGEWIITEVRLFDSATGKQVDTLAGAHPEGLGVDCDSMMLTAAYSPDGKLLAAAGKLVKAGAFAGMHIGAEVCVWNLHTRKLLWYNWTTHTNIVREVAFSPDGRTLASGGDDQLIRLWDPETDALKKTLFGVAYGALGALSFSPDGTILASGGQNPPEENNAIRLWDVQSGRLLRTLGYNPNEYATRIAFSRDGKTLFSVSGTKDAKRPIRQVRMFEVATGKLKGVLGGREGNGGIIRVSPNGKMLAVGTIDGEVELYDLPR